jgi:hypothetical protein
MIWIITGAEEHTLRGWIASMRAQQDRHKSESSSMLRNFDTLYWLRFLCANSINGLVTMKIWHCHYEGYVHAVTIYSHNYYKWHLTSTVLMWQIYLYYIFNCGKYFFHMAFHVMQYHMDYGFCRIKRCLPGGLSFLNVLHRVYLCARGLHLLHFITISTGAALYGKRNWFSNAISGFSVTVSAESWFTHLK